MLKSAHIRRREPRDARPLRQRGILLVEAAVAMLLFLLGIMGMVAVSARAVTAQSDAQYRTLAAALSNQIAQQAWLAVDRSSGDATVQDATVRAALATFQHQPGGTDCNHFSGTPSSHAAVVNWVAAVRNAANGGLPGTTEFTQQIVIDSTANGYNKLTITLCWKAPSDVTYRRHVFATFVH